MNFSTYLNFFKSNFRGIVSCSLGDKEFFITVDRIGFIYVLCREDGHNLSVYRKHRGHIYSISSICLVKSWKGEETLITGGLEKRAKFWRVSDLLDLEKNLIPYFKFTTGDNVCCIRELSKGEICILSWDGTSTILFEDDRENIVLHHDKFYAWDIIKTNDYYITADASQSISLFNHSGSLVNKIEHVDKSPLRLIFQYQGNIFVGSNSGVLHEFSIKEGSLENKKEHRITNEGFFSYCIKSNILYIGGDDKVVYVFDLDKLSVIDVLPVIGCVWGCNFGCITGDLSISTEKGNIFIYTNDLTRKASEEEAQDFLEELGSTPIPSSSVLSDDPSDYPTKVEEETARPGLFYGIQNDGEVEIVIYSSGFGKYVCVGKVESHKKVIGPDSKKYDTSITVIGEDETVYELYMNYTDDPNDVATKFCAENKLNDRFINQIVEFINLNIGDKVKNAKKIKKESAGNFDSVSFGVSEMQGRRQYMEDRNISFQLPNKKSVFCVFDGHGGQQASTFAQENIQSFIEKNIESSSPDSLIANALMQMNEQMCPQFQDVGSTATVCLYSQDDHLFYTSNLGDSRAVLCREKPIQLTVDHKASNEEERKLIEKNGGTVTDDRISGVINLSRFLGDGIFANYAIKEPYSSVTKVQKGDRILIGSDGIFDFLSNEECSEIIRKAESPEKAATAVRDQSYDYGSADNLTAIVIEILN